jgi:hypothetical protein
VRQAREEGARGGAFQGGGVKTAIYIEDGTVQLVITPETEFEKNSLSTFTDSPLDAKVFSGSFYDCRGGWVRQAGYYPTYSVHGGDANDKSLILRIGKEAAE